MTDVAYKVVDRDEWDAAVAAGAYAGSEVDRADGYIHMSTRAQLPETARKHYADRRDLVLVTVELSGLGEALKWEASRGGDLFPHLYAALPATTAVTARSLSVDADGTPRFDDGTVGWS